MEKVCAKCVTKAKFKCLECSGTFCVHKVVVVGDGLLRHVECLDCVALRALANGI